MYVSMWLNGVEMGWSNVGKGVFDGLVPMWVGRGKGVPSGHMETHVCER